MHELRKDEPSGMSYVTQNKDGSKNELYIYILLVLSASLCVERIEPI